MVTLCNFVKLIHPLRFNIAFQGETKYLLNFRNSLFTNTRCKFSFNANNCCKTSKSYKNGKELWEKIKTACNDNLILLGEILTEQCNFYASQRIRRMSQVWNLYTTLYTEKSFRCLVSKLKRLLNNKKKPLGFLLSAAVFNWESEKISDEEIKSCSNELDQLWGKNCEFLSGTSQCPSSLKAKLNDEGWELVISKESLEVWRKSMPGTYLYEYKVLGSFYDIPAEAFFSVQIDTEYRKRWDKLVIRLDVIDREEINGGCEVLHWVMHYPYPMYSRDYVYVRRAEIDGLQNKMVLVSRAIDHPACPKNKKYVRVTKYSSTMVIRPHKNFTENGFDYLLTYFDDPQAAFPAPAYNWMASSGVPEFVEKLHRAAKDLYLKSWEHTESSLPQSTTGKRGSSSSVEYVYNPH